MHRELAGIVGLAIVLLLSGTPLHSSVRPLFFDMGTEQSAVRSGFIKITAQSAHADSNGFGWRNTQGLKEFDRPYNGWIYNKRYEREVPPPVFTNELTEDMVHSDLPNEFLVDVSPGRYCVYALSGRSEGGEHDHYVFDISVADQSSRVEIAGSRIFEKRQFCVEAAGGQLAISLRPVTTWLLSALLIFPETERSRVEKEVIAPIEQEIFLLPAAEWEKWEEIKTVEENPMPIPTPAEESRGFFMYVRHCLKPVYPNTIPLREELDSTLKMYAALGEYESASFAILPLRDLDECMVTAGALRGPGVIPVSDIDVRSVRYMPARPTYLGLYKYLKIPDVLEPVRPASLEKNVNQQYWITVKVPEDATPGVYRGELLFTSKNGSATVDLVLNVLPIRLQKNPELIYGIYYRDPLGKVKPENKSEANEYFSRKAELERRDMAEHGLDAHDSYVNFKDWDTFAVDAEDIQRRLDLDWKYGINKKVIVLSFPDKWQEHLLLRTGTSGSADRTRRNVPQAFFEDITKMVRAVENERIRRGWPEFLYYPIDEPKAAEDSVRFTAKVLEAVKRMEGVRTFVTANPARRAFDPLWPYVDVWCSQPFVRDDNTIAQFRREKHIEFWSYPNHISGELGHTLAAGARMTWGVGLWRSGYKAVMPWIYQYVAGDPYNYLDGPMMDFMNRSTPTGLPVPVVLWESFREGMDDGKYIYTLQTLIEGAKKSGSPEKKMLAVQAESDLKHIRDSIPVQEKYIRDGVWSGEEFDTFRRLIASDILALSGESSP